MMKTLYSPGETCPQSGLWEIVRESDGYRTGTQRTIVSGEPFPPTPLPRHGYRLDEPTRL